RINIEYGAFKIFNYARICSYRTAPYLIGLMKEIQASKNAKEEWTTAKMTLFHHSMGNIMLKRILQDGMDSTISPELFDQLVLNAPCVDQDGHKKWLEKSRLAKKTILHYNKDDKQLNGAKILAIKTQLGARLHRPLASNTQYVDFNPLMGDSHSNFLDIPKRPKIQPKAKKYYYQLFHGQAIDYSDTSQFGMGWKGIGVSLKK
ncbi:MAG: alpha/beta hydrolase, partial [Cytophagales bacterium]|nr:alpha/beta hydrolase [Cytophagales bacterium]